MLEPTDFGAATLSLRTSPMPLLSPLPRAIVVVDDEPDVLIIMHRLLRDLAHDHALIAVSSAHAALANIALCAVPLLITDYNMLGMNGLELIAAVKRTTPQTRTVLITAYDSPELQRRARAAPVDYYLAKPFPLDRLEQIVRETLLSHVTS
jgi:two-component system response regulator (stage 0 sporulation protein F)